MLTGPPPKFNGTRDIVPVGPRVCDNVVTTAGRPEWLPRPYIAVGWALDPRQ